MNCEFANKQLKLAEIIEKRDVQGSQEDKVPSKFSFVLLNGELKCVWTTKLSPLQTSHVLFHTTISKHGLTPEEWNDLTKRLYDYL